MANAIETKKLTKVFGDRKALDKVSIEVPEGAFLSIFGPNARLTTTEYAATLNKMLGLIRSIDEVNES